MNHNTKWFCFLNVLEYFFWFKSSLHFFARVGMTPLGGNTVFVRRELMEQLGGWDETCLTEEDYTSFYRLISANGAGAKQ